MLASFYFHFSTKDEILRELKTTGDQVKNKILKYLKGVQMAFAQFLNFFLRRKWNFSTFNNFWTENVKNSTVLESAHNQVAFFDFQIFFYYLNIKKYVLPLIIFFFNLLISIKSLRDNY